MKFIEVEKPGGPEVLRVAQCPTPKPGKGEVLIRVAAAGVNRADILGRKGHYPPPPGASSILGLEVSGVIAECGADSEPWKVGDKVCALVSSGGYSEYCVAPAPQCLPIPKGMSFEMSAALPEAFFTVWSNVFMRGRLLYGETLLVHGGTSGIGTTAIQIAKAFGSQVIVTVGSDEKAAACLKWGACAAINYKTQDFVAEVKRITEGRGVDVILDMVGGPYVEKNIECLAREGRLVQIAFQKGSSVQVDLRSLMDKGAWMSGSMLRPRSVAQKGAIAGELKAKVWPKLESGLIQVALDDVFPLEKASEAHQKMEASSHFGKIVLKVKTTG